MTLCLYTYASFHILPRRYYTAFADRILRRHFLTNNYKGSFNFIERHRLCTHNFTCSLHCVSNNQQLSTIEESLKSFKDNMDGLFVRVAAMGIGCLHPSGI